MRIGQHTDPIIFFVLSSFLIVFFYYLALDRFSRVHDWHPVGLFAFLGLPIAYLDSLGVIRQFIAIAIFIYIVSNIKRNIFLSLVYLIIATLFHKSIVILIPIILLRKFLTKPKSIIIYFMAWGLFVLAGSFFLTAASLYTGLYSIYLKIHLSNSGLKIYLLLSLILLYFIHNRKIIFSDPDYTFLFHCYFIGILLFSASLPFGIHISRISWSLLAVHPLIFGIILRQKTAEERSLVIIGSFLIMCTSLYLSSQNSERDFLNQYQPFFSLDQFQRDLIIEKSLQTEIHRE